jgi:hypothetical protein
MVTAMVAFLFWRNMSQLELTPMQVVFDVRRIWYKDECYFSVIDVVGVLTESPEPKRYWTDLNRSELNSTNFAYSSNTQNLNYPNFADSSNTPVFSVALPMLSKDGKKRKTIYKTNYQQHLDN